MWWLKKKKNEPEQEELKSDRERFHALYVSKEWRKLRLHKLTNNPLCEHCLKKGIVMPAVHVDHIIPLALRYDLRLDYDNLQSLDASCHSRKTATIDRMMKEGKEPKDILEDLLNFD